VKKDAVKKQKVHTPHVGKHAHHHHLKHREGPKKTHQVITGRQKLAPHVPHAHKSTKKAVKKAIVAKKKDIAKKAKAIAKVAKKSAKVAKKTS